MKIFKSVFVFLVFLFGALVLTALLSGEERIISTTIDINAKKNVVYNAIGDLSNWKNWDAFYSNDSLQKRTSRTKRDKRHSFSGLPDSLAWLSDVYGKGKIHHLSTQGDSNFYSISFSKFNLLNEGESFIAVTPSRKSVKVTWQYNSVKKFPYSILNVFPFFSVESEMQTSLKQLKSYCENNTVIVPKSNIKEINIKSFFGTSYVTQWVEPRLMELQTSDFIKVNAFLSDNLIDAKSGETLLWFPSQDNSVLLAKAISDNEVTSLDSVFVKDNFNAESIGWKGAIGTGITGDYAHVIEIERDQLHLVVKELSAVLLRKLKYVKEPYVLELKEGQIIRLIAYH